LELFSCGGGDIGELDEGEIDEEDAWKRAWKGDGAPSARDLTELKLGASWGGEDGGSTEGLEGGTMVGVGLLLALFWCSSSSLAVFDQRAAAAADALAGGEFGLRLEDL